MRPTYQEQEIVSILGGKLSGFFLGSYPCLKDKEILDKAGFKSEIYCWVDKKKEKAKDYVFSNLKEILSEDIEEIEFDLYDPLCDTALYYFYAGEDLSLYTDENDYFDHEYSDFSFEDHCAMIGLHLPEFGDKLLNYKE